MADSKHEHLEEDKTADYWVVQDDKVVRVHQTPRHHLFDPKECEFPLPLEYIDVFRCTDTNVNGYHSFVDCWYTDPTGDQIPGPWVGKTSFNLRLPAPKPGWAIQNGRPTKIEANSKRPEYVWVEEWRHMTRKSQLKEMSRWEILKPRVDSAREERNLNPIQKFNHQFWDELKKAKEQFRPPTAPGMPLLHAQEPKGNVAAQVQQFSAFQDCVGILQKRIALLESQLPERASELPTPEPHRPHEERQVPTRMRSSDHFGLIHTPVHDYQKIPEARAAVDKEFDKLEKFLPGIATRSGKGQM